MIPSAKPVTDALVALVAAATARAVGDGDLPVAGDPPFSVVYPLPGGDSWGPDYVAPQAAAVLAYQITHVGVSRATAEAHADLVRHAVCDRDADGLFVTPLAPAGLIVLDRELVTYGAVVADRGAYSIADTFQIAVTIP